MDSISWTTEKRTVESLAPWSRNPRRITEKQMADLQKSLAKFGYAAPIVINADGHIIAGHMRLKAMVLLKMIDSQDEVDVRVPSRLLDKEEAQELAVRDNKAGGEWDMDILSADFEIGELLDFGFKPFELGIDDPDGTPKKDKEPGAGVPVIAYNMVFNSMDEQDAWHDFLAWLRTRFGEYDTHAERVIAGLNEYKRLVENANG